MWFTHLLVQRMAKRPLALARSAGTARTRSVSTIEERARIMAVLALGYRPCGGEISAARRASLDKW